MPLNVFQQYNIQNHLIQSCEFFFSKLKVIPYFKNHYTFNFACQNNDYKKFSLYIIYNVGVLYNWGEEGGKLGYLDKIIHGHFVLKNILI